MGALRVIGPHRQLVEVPGPARTLAGVHWKSGERIDTLLESLGAQAATLERRLEKDLLGNHLLKNIKALLFAGALLETPRSARWWAKGEALLEQQLNEQILPDGGHFERSPMYHSQILEDLAEIRLLSVPRGSGLLALDLLSREDRVHGVIPERDSPS